MTRREERLGPDCSICIGGPDVIEGMCSTCRGATDAERHRLKVELRERASFHKMREDYHREQGNEYKRAKHRGAWQGLELAARDLEKFRK